MKTRAEQRHEYLIEEEKKITAQIRSVAATLYERVDLDKLTVDYFFMLGSTNVMLIAAASHIENENKMTQRTDALKILILQLLLEKY
jgi:hypothetical protein